MTKRKKVSRIGLKISVDFISHFSSVNIAFCMNGVTLNPKKQSLNLARGHFFGLSSSSVYGGPCVADFLCATTSIYDPMVGTNNEVWPMSEITGNV